MTTGERIKAARIKRGITQQALANKIGASYQQISQYERDIRKPKLETIQRIADALNVLITDFIEVNYANPDELFSEWMKSAPPLEDLSFDMKIFRELLNLIGYDFQKTNGNYFMVVDGVFKVSEEEIKQLEKQIADFLKFQCQQLEEKHTPELLRKSPSDKVQQKAAEQAENLPNIPDQQKK